MAGLWLRKGSRHFHEALPLSQYIVACQSKKTIYWVTAMTEMTCIAKNNRGVKCRWRGVEKNRYDKMALILLVKAGAVYSS